MYLTGMTQVSWRRRWCAQEQLDGGCEDEDGAEHRDCEEGPEKNPVQHLSHKLPVLNYLEEGRSVHYHYHDCIFIIKESTIKKSLVLLNIIFIPFFILNINRMLEQLYYCKTSLNI